MLFLQLGTSEQLFANPNSCHPNISVLIVRDRFVIMAAREWGSMQ